MKTCFLTALLLASAGAWLASAADDLARDFAHPPSEARIRAYWWWLNGQVTKAAITRDLEEMKAKGFGGALICDAGGAEQDGNDRVPHGPTFFSPEWRELYKHALREADRLGLEMSLNIQSGWNLGGPMVKAEDAPKKLVWSEIKVRGPAKLEQTLAEPKHPKEFYRDLFVVACPVKPAAAPGRRPIQSLEQKALLRPLHFSAPDTTLLLQDVPPEPGEEDARAGDVSELSSKMSPDGVLRWEAPAGEWVILRFGCTLNDHSKVSTSSDGWQGYALDPFDAAAFRRYWDAVVEPLIADAGPLAGRALKYLHTDSWEVEVANWTPTLREEFLKRRSYDLVPFLPVIAGRIVDSRPVSNRFLHDLRRTMGDLAIANHYQLFRDGAHRHGLLIHPESGGPHAVPIDAQQCLSFNDAPMSEFWAWSWRHRVGDSNRFFVKQPASAAHSSGRRLVLAEGFTTIGPHWQETLWDNLKPSFDRAICEGLNRLVWHAFVCSPAEFGQPGIQYFAGTHLNPNVTWWEKSGAFFAYLNRCQFLMQRGLFVADAAYYYGDHVPNFAQLRSSDPARVLPGYDYDVVTEETILTRMSARDGRLVLPDGMNYRVLVLPDRRAISLPVLRKVKELVASGATVIGPKPREATGLMNYPQNDAEVAQLADALWGQESQQTAVPVNRQIGAGRVVWGRTAREVLLEDGVKPDFEARIETVRAEHTGSGAVGISPALLDFIHRRDGETDIYFVANPSNACVTATCAFRVSGKAPELWEPLSGSIRALPVFSGAEGRTEVSLEFAPYGSWFIVFRKATPSAASASAGRNFPGFVPIQEIAAPWTVKFDSRWDGPEQVEFSRLVSWTARSEEGIRFYSGTATYRKVFDLAEPTAAQRGSPAWLDLGGVRELAEVRLNGWSLGVIWAPPFRVDVTGLLKPAGNELEIEVVNFWPNRIIGDAALPPAQRLTQTNIRKLTRDTRLMESGLFGPVRLLKKLD